MRTAIEPANGYLVLSAIHMPIFSRSAGVRKENMVVMSPLKDSGAEFP